MESIKRTPEPFNLEELSKPWESSFYESAWEVHTLNLTKTEKAIIDELTTFLPRHMAVYDWNLPYAEEVILCVRRHVKDAITNERAEAERLKKHLTDLVLDDVPHQYQTRLLEALK